MTCRTEIQHNLLPHTGTNDGLVARYSSDDESSDGEGEGSEEDGELHHGWRLRTADEADGTLPPYVRERLSDQSAYIQKLEAQNLDLQEVRSTLPLHDCRFVPTCYYMHLSSDGRANVAANHMWQPISGFLSLVSLLALQRCSLLQHELQELKATHTTSAAAVGPAKGSDVVPMPKEGAA